MGQLATLGPPSGPRGVDQGRRVADSQGRQAGGELVGIHPGTRSGQLVEGVGAAGSVDGQHPAQCGHLAGQLVDHGSVGVGLGEDQHRTGVFEDPTHLLGRGRFIDRNGDGTDGQDREVQDRPLIACRGEDHHPISGGDALGDQSQRRGPDLRGGLRAGDVGPHPGDQPLVDDDVRVVAFVFEDDRGDVVVLLDGERCGNTELTHACDLSWQSGYLVDQPIGRPVAGVTVFT